MNKAITDGLNLTLPAFQDGLQNWSNQNGRPGDTTYDTVSAGTLIASDPDFGPCLELRKEDATQRLRSVNEVPILPGCYLQIRARVKAQSAQLASVRIAAWPGNTAGGLVGGVDRTGPATQLTAQGRIETITAIVGSGLRTGVDMVWGTAPVFGHFGIDVLGPTGALVRVESIEVVDLTSAFHRVLMDWVDVRDYGAVGDGVTDDANAFLAADADADGRDVLVPDGTYFIGRSITMLNNCRFEGTVTMADEHHFILRENYTYLAYVQAFGDETLGLKKALQALFRFADHESLDLGGRHVQLDAPIDVAAAVNTVTNFSNRRGIRNGILSANTTPAWDPTVVTATASYNRTAPQTLSNVTNIANIPVGALVEGNGVGREIFVTAKNEAAGQLTISQPLVRAAASQGYTFTRFKYLLDFSGFERLARFQVNEVEFLGRGVGSGLMLPPEGIAWSIRDCWFTRPANRAITSIGRGCNGISIDRNQFIAPDTDQFISNRVATAYNTNSNDMKIRNNRCVDFVTFGVMAGGGHIIVGNHFWQLDNNPTGERTAGLVLCQGSAKTTITGNYIDGHYLEFTNEYEVNPDNPTRGFGTIAVVGNIFTTLQVPAWYRFIVITPYGNGQWIDGLTVVGNAFKPISGTVIDRVDRVDTSNGSLNLTRTQHLDFHSNSYANVTNRAESPAVVSLTQTTAASGWTANLAAKLPFGARAMGVEGVVALGPIRNGANTVRYLPFHVDVEQGAGAQSVTVRWPEPVIGRVQLKVRGDRPS